MSETAETYYAGAYWLARPESAEACARRAERFFDLLGRCEPAWACWYETADSFEEARKRRFITDAPNFRRLFAQEKRQIGEGFSYDLWTGDTQEETSVVNGACGFSSLHLPSTCVLRPYDEGPIGERVLTAPVMAEVLRAMALAWDPEWGVATSYEHQVLLTKGESPDTFAGWVMYFSRLRGRVPPLPAPVRIEPVEDLGTLVILTPARFTVSNSEHVALAASVRDLLNRAGLLRPLQPWPSGGHSRA